MSTGHSQIWSYRFLEKSLLDLQRIGATRDLGVAFRGSLGSEQKVRYHLMFGNGSNTRGELDRGKGTTASLGFYPNDSWVLEFYGDYNNLPVGADRNTYSAFLAYKRDWGRVGIQYAHQERKGLSPVSLDLMSVFGFFHLSPKLTFIGRYDRMFDPNPEGSNIPYIPFDPTAKFHFFLTGIDWKVTEEFSLLPNIDSEREIELWMTRGDLGLLFIFRTIVFRGMSDMKGDQTGHQHGQVELAGL